MRLLSVTIQNFRTIAHTTIEFSDEVVGIIGRNGAGKSSIIEAIAWSLYGNVAARSGKDEVKATFCPAEGDCQVRLSFTINSNSYMIDRRLIGNSNRQEVELFLSGESVSVGVVETRTAVEQLLGLDWRGFISSFLARQSELNALSDYPPAKRREHIAGMLGIERLDQAVAAVKAENKGLAEQTVFMEKQLAERSILAAGLDQLESTLPELATDEKQADIAVKSAKKHLDETLERLQKEQQKKETYDRAQARLQQADHVLALYVEQITQKKERLKKLTLLVAEMTPLKEKVAQLPALIEKKEGMDEAMTRRDLRRSLQLRLEEIESTYEQAQKKLGQEKSRKEQLNIERDKIQAEQVVDLDKLSGQLEQARQKYSELMATGKSFQNEINRVDQQLSQITSLGSASVCDRCQRPLGDDVTSITQHLGDERTELEKKLKISQDELRLAEKDGKKLKEDVEKAGLINQKIAELHGELTTLDKDLLRYTEDLNSIAEIKTRCVKELSAVPEVTFDESEYKNLGAAIKSLDEKKERLARMEGELSTGKTIEDELADIEEKHRQQQTLRKDVEKECHSIGYLPEQFQEISSAHAQALTGFEHAREQLQGISQRLLLLQQEIASKKEQLERLDALNRELDTIRDRHYYGEKLAGLFTSFRKHLIASIRPSLAAYASELLATMTDGRYTMLELDEEYNISLFDQGSWFQLDRFSGGESDLANLCLRLAISRALVQSSGMSHSFVILDEVFGSQDMERQQLILSALSRLKEIFPQILLITHIDDIKEGVEKIIEVTPTGRGFSEVAVHETT